MWGKHLNKLHLHHLTHKPQNMATIKPIIKGKGESVKIYIRLRNGRNHDYTIKTDFVINEKDWSTTTNRPKATTVKNKNLKTTIDKLYSRIEENLNEISLNGLEPSKPWLENIYNKFVNKESNEQNAEITYWIKFIIDNADLFENSIGEKGLSKNRIKQYKTLLGIFEDYQGKNRYKVIEINQNFHDMFFNWLHKNKGYAHNTCKKNVDDLIAVGKHARKYKIPTSKELDYIKRVRVRVIKPIILEDSEIKQIVNAELTKPYLKNTRKWFLLGLQLAQRVSDLLPLTENNIHYVSNLDNELIKCLIFHQKKSQNTKEIIIPIDNVIEEILKDGFPSKISSQRFNEYLKEVCLVAEINKPTNGTITEVVKINGKKVTRKKEGVFPKYKLITSHTLRKTATTHYYQVFGSKVKHITGHSKEETVNLYVNEDRSRKLSQVQQMRKQYQSIKKSENKPQQETQLKVIKNVSNKN